MKRLLTFILLLAFIIPLQAQLKGKLEEVISGDIFFEQLRTIFNDVQGGDDKAVPRFLANTMENPDTKVIPLADFRKEKERYYALCKEYNQIIDDIIGTVQRFEKLKDVREIPLLDYQGRITVVGTKFTSFFNDLSKYNKEMGILGFILDVYKFGKPIVQHLIQEKIERIQRVLIEQLKGYKLTPLAWEPAEAVLAGGQAPANREVVKGMVGLQAADHYRALDLAPKATIPQIDAAYTQLSSDYKAESASTNNIEIKEFYANLLIRVESAKRYFDANPPKAPVAIVERKSATGDGGAGGCTALKSELEGLMRGAKYMTREQLVTEIQEVLSKY
jgi:hypothetical protein